MTKKEMAAYLRGFADGDGYISTPHPHKVIRLYNDSLPLLKIMKSYLKVLGIESHLRGRFWNGKKRWLVYVSKRGNLELWDKLIGFNHPKKKKRLKRIMIAWGNVRKVHWTGSEIRKLLKMNLEGKQHKIIAEELGRSPNAITHRLMALRKRGIKIEKVCFLCGEKHLPTSGNQLYCRACGKATKKQRNNESALRSYYKYHGRKAKKRWLAKQKSRS